MAVSVAASWDQSDPCCTDKVPPCQQPLHTANPLSEKVGAGAFGPW